MQRTVMSIHTDECPYLNEEHSISINYAELFNNQYKKMTYSCNQGSECTFKDKYGQCPVYKNAPNTP
ncbi:MULTISPECIES: hypothetical protein [Clostridium]|uniref:hypothetical protein n=1 Tax=Clostridium TaxID=1485 RepID=UPI001EF37E06|nr:MULTISPECIES: hypothetical protein [Clostridium]